MASSISTKQDLPFPRRLSEVLKEDQEPFVLEIYLLERGCKLRSSSYYGSSSSKSSRNYYLQFSNIAKHFYTTILFINKGLGFKSLVINKGRSKITSDEQVVLESDGLSSATTLCNTCFANDVDESAPNRVTSQWRLMEDNKQFSTVSVLDEIDLLQNIPVYNYNVRQQGTTSTSQTRFHHKVSLDSILTASLFELLMQSKISHRERDNLRLPIPLPMRNFKKAPRQTRQLLFDCVKEVVQMSHKGQYHQIRSIRSSNQKGLVIGPEEMGKIVCNNFKGWGKLSTRKSKAKIVQLLRVDMLGSSDEWGIMEECKRNVSWDIGDCILENIIVDIVKEIIHSN